MEAIEDEKEQRALFEDALRNMSDDEAWIDYKMSQFDEIADKEDDEC